MVWSQPQPVPQASPPVEQKETKSAAPEQSRKELQQAIQGSNDVLIKASTTLTAFPDTLTVDRAKLTVTKRSFASSAELVSMLDKLGEDDHVSERPPVT